MGEAGGLAGWGWCILAAWLRARRTNEIYSRRIFTTHREGASWKICLGGPAAGPAGAPIEGALCETNPICLVFSPKTRVRLKNKPNLRGSGTGAVGG